MEILELDRALYVLLQAVLAMWQWVWKPYIGRPAMIILQLATMHFTDLLPHLQESFSMAETTTETVPAFTPRPVETIVFETKKEEIIVEDLAKEAMEVMTKEESTISVTIPQKEVVQNIAKEHL
jgi:tRNA A37 threonylcarbamoyladenosine synthetase subunit TsaC/SUA5/YrdC